MLGTEAKLLTKSLNKQQMQNWKTSARTAAQQSSKSPLLFRPAALAAILLLAAVVSSCNIGKKQPMIIISKSYLTFTNNPMPNGICRFYYKDYEFGEAQEFNDSCYKYSVGDTITGRSVNSR